MLKPILCSRRGGLGWSMRLLFAVVHYYKAGDGRHGSLAADPKPRIDALRRLILQIHRLYGQPAGLLNHRQRRVDGVDDGGGPVDLRVCVSGDCHVLDRLSDCEGLYRQEACHPEDPRSARFRSSAGICSRLSTQLKPLENRLITSLTWKTTFFSLMQIFPEIALLQPRLFGNEYLLMPNRIETMEHQGHLRRFYIDGRLQPCRFRRNIASARTSCSASPILVRWCVLISLRIFIPAVFFLNREQARTYASSGHAAAIDTSFHGPLESAATLGMLKTFQLMKPALENGRFLTVEHGGRNFMGLVPHCSTMAEQLALIDWPLTPLHRLGELWDSACPGSTRAGPL